MQIISLERVSRYEEERVFMTTLSIFPSLMMKKLSISFLLDHPSSSCVGTNRSLIYICFNTRDNLQTLLPLNPAVLSQGVCRLCKIIKIE